MTMPKTLILAAAALLLAVFTLAAAPTITTSTITAGNGDVTIDSNGIQITAGPAARNTIRWSDGTWIGGWSTDVLDLHADNVIDIEAGSVDVILNASGLFYPSGTVDLGASSGRFDDLYLGGNIDWNPPDTTTDQNPVVYDGTAGTLKEKTNGESKTCDTASNFTVESGIVTSCSAAGADAAPVRGELATLRRRVARLEAELAELRVALGVPVARER